MVSRQIAALAALFGLAVAGSCILVSRAQRTASPRQAGIDSHRSLGEAKTFRNLTVFPVYDSTTKASDTYVTLDEGLKANKVKVKESQHGGDVNTLYVTNSGKKPLYLMAGEVVLGGQQDRTLARDTIVQPGRRNVPITVYCVEHGRWSGRSEFSQSAPAVASASIRASAMEGEFKATKSRIALQAAARPTTGRSTSQSAAQAQIRAGLSNQPEGSSIAEISGAEDVAKAQQKVWDGVAMKNRRLKIENQTGTYRDALTMNAGDAQRNIPAYVRALSGGLGRDSHLIGAVAAINGKVVAADIFGDPVLFRKLWPKLLRSYAADAVEMAQSKTSSAGKAPSLSIQQVRRFLADAKNEKSREANTGRDSVILRYESTDASTYSLVPAGSKVMGAMGKPLHESVIRK